jgi:hypothetical protein
MLAEAARNQDELHVEFGIEHEEFEHSLMDLMQTDPEVRNTMNACMADMKLLIEKEI